LKSALKKNDSFNRQSHKLDSVITDNNHDSNDLASSYKIKWLLDKKVTNVRSKTKIEYLIRWLNYRSEWNVWYNIENFQQASDLITDYEKIFNNASEKSSLVIKLFKCCDRSLKCCDRFIKSCDRSHEF